MTGESVNQRMSESRFHASRITYHVLLLFLLPLILLAPLIFGGRVLYWGVPLMQFYPWQHFAVETWRIGEVPLWNPLVGNGAPLAANLQTGVFYPLNALYLILPTEIAMGYTAALHVILAGLFMFAFARSIGLRPLPALIAAVAFQLSGFFIARLGFLSITVTFPWVAAWLWRAERAMQSNRMRDALWLAIGIGSGLLAGHAQMAVYGMILLAAYTLYRSFIARRQFALLVVGIGVLLGIGLAAIQLLPAAELARESQRAQGLDYDFAMTHSYWPWRLLTLFTPDLFGNPAYGNFWGYDNYWENAAYIGLLPLALVGVAIRGWWRFRRMNASREGGRWKLEVGGWRLDWLTPFFALTALVSLIFAFGWFTPIYPVLFRAIPGFSMFQGPARWLSVFTLALCVLAGIGAESMPHGRGDLRRSAKWNVIGFALIVAGLASRGILVGLTATFPKGMFPHETFPDATLRLGMLVAAGGLLFGLRPALDDRRFPGWTIAFVAVAAIDLLTAHAALNPTIEPALYRLPAQSAAAMRAEGEGRVFMFEADDAMLRQRFGIYLPFDDFGPTDIDRWIEFRATMIANTSMIDGMASAGNFDSLLVGHSLQLWEAINTQPFDIALRLLNLMHVRYIASPRDLDLPVVYESDSATIYRNPDALPRAWIVPSARVESDPLAAILDPEFDPSSEAILDTPPLPAETISDTRYAIRDTLISLHDTPNTVKIRAASDSDGYLVLADTWYPGWRATIDGQVVDVLRANVAFRAIAFPAGEHLVEFRYEPASFRMGAWTTIASIVIVAGGLVISTWRRQ